MNQEEIARKRAQDKQEKLANFQNKTKANAQKRLKQEEAMKKEADEKKKLDAKEKAIKAKEYAKKQRDIILNKKPPSAQGPRPDLGKKSQVHKEIVNIVNIDQSHIQPVRRAPNNEDVIIELSEENTSQFTQSQYSLKKPVKQEVPIQQAPITMYQRIDQEELEKNGLSHKSELSKDSGGLLAAHKFSMLQRFRQSKDFRAIDRYKPQCENIEEIKDQEKSWMRQNVQTEEEREKEKKSKVEKARYLTALKALVQEKGQKMNPDNGEIPPLCSCGAMLDNIKQAKKGDVSGNDFQLCASNC